MANRDFRGRNQLPRGTNQSYTGHLFPGRWRPSSGPQLPGPRFFAQGEEDSRTWVPPRQAAGLQQHPPMTIHRNMPHNYENPSLPIMRQQLPPHGEMRHEIGLWNQNPNTQRHLTEQQFHFGTTISTDQTQQQTRYVSETQQQHQLSQSYNQSGAQFGLVDEIERDNKRTRDLLANFAKFTISDKKNQPIITGLIPSHEIQDCETKTYTLGTNLRTRHQEWGHSFTPAPPFPERIPDPEKLKNYKWTLWHRKYGNNKPTLVAGANIKEELQQILVENNAAILPYNESYFFRLRRSDLPDLSDTEAFKSTIKQEIGCFSRQCFPTSEYEPGPPQPNEILAKRWEKLLQALMKKPKQLWRQGLHRVIIGAYVKYYKERSSSNTYSKIAIVINPCTQEHINHLRSRIQSEGIETFGNWESDIFYRRRL